MSLDRSIAAEIARKRLIFTVCTGRCGTELLAQRLGHLPGVHCEHEPQPNFVEAMRSVQSDPEAARRFWMHQKLPAIAASPFSIYAETTHLFCKGFLEPLLDLGCVPSLILLTRPHREVAQSLLRLNCIPARTEAGRAYLLQPDDPGVLPLHDWRSLHDYQLCYWYCLEIERRQHAAHRLVTSLGGKAVWTTLSEVRTAGGMQQIISGLGLPHAGLWRKLLWTATSIHRVNRKRRHTRTLEAEYEIEALEQQVTHRLGGSPKDRKRAA